MPCYHPQPCWWYKEPNADGKQPRFFNRLPGCDLPLVQLQERYPDLEFGTSPCGRCVGCRGRDKSDWAVRNLHEASLYEKNCFLNLTYDKEHFPVDGGLHHFHWQDFMKRFRKKFCTPPDDIVDEDLREAWLLKHGIRYYMCGEYGDRNFRPHYHAIIFNFDFPDKKPWRRKGKYLLYRSAILDELWGLGHAEIGSVTNLSTAYVSGYVLKKVGAVSKMEYSKYDEKGKLVWSIQPPYAKMSLKPGIGSRWFDEFFESDVLPHDSVVVAGKEVRPPRYYDKKFAVKDPERSKLVKKARVDHCNSNPLTLHDLKMGEINALARAKRFGRDLG